MMFEQPFSLAASVGFISAIALLVFGYKVYAFNRHRYSSLFQLPSVIVMGHGPSKTHVMSGLTKSGIVSYPSHDIDLSYLNVGNKTMQIIDPKNMFINDRVDTERLNEVRRLNCKLLLYLFDLSRDSSSISMQLNNFHKAVDTFGNIGYVPVATRLSDRKKLNSLRKRFDKLHEIYMDAEDDFDKLRASSQKQVN